MRHLSAEEKRDLALKVNAKTSKSGKTLTPQYIHDEDEIVNQFREYLRKESLARYGEGEDISNRHRKMVSDMVAELGAEQLAYHMPALIFFFKRYLTQH